MKFRRIVGVMTAAVAMVLWNALPASAAVTWTVQPTPTPPSSLNAVTCLSVSNCTAVGEAKILHWNGGRWAVQATAPANGALKGVACTSATRCIAVGSLGDSGGNVDVRLLAEVWNGTQWNTQPVPNPVTPSPGSNSMSLNAVECLGPANCLAVGSYGVNGSTGRVLIEKWNGTAWRIQPAPTRPGSLSAIDCQSATSCFAAGSDGSSGNVLVEHWNGTKWAVQAVPALPPYLGTPPSAADFGGISCVGSKICTAVGDVFYDFGSPSSWTHLTLAERWDGSRWVRQSTPNPGGVNGLNSVTCVSTSDCIAVGAWEADVNSTLSFLVMAWNGTKWTTKGIADPSLHGGSLSGISCTTVCTVVGARFADTGALISLAERSSGIY
jgi:hypothetical protein